MRMHMPRRAIEGAKMPVRKYRAFSRVSVENSTLKEVFPFEHFSDVSCKRGIGILLRGFRDEENGEGGTKFGRRDAVGLP